MSILEKAKAESIVIALIRITEQAYFGAWN